MYQVGENTNLKHDFFQKNKLFKLFKTDYVQTL